MSENILYNVLECLKKYWKNASEEHANTGSSRLMRISLLRISLLRFFKTITKNFPNAIFMHY